MNWGGPDFVLIIVAMSTGGWLINNWIRARHGYPLEDEWGGKTDRKDGELAALREENRQLLSELGPMRQRLATLESIVTDKSYTLAHEIDALKKLPDPANATDRSAG